MLGTNQKGPFRVKETLKNGEWCQEHETQLI